MAKQFVKSKPAPNKVVVLRKLGCPYYHKAVDLLNELCLRSCCMGYMDLTVQGDADEIQNYFQQTMGTRTVFHIFIGEKCIGSYTDLESLYRNGELKYILEKIGLNEEQR
uniref:Glutaredoxin n=1 Tax=Salvator merianae TaxID=96440 RepID=A0A8D0BPB1_SALMN